MNQQEFYINIISLHHSSMNQFMLQKQIIAEQTCQRKARQQYQCYVVIKINYQYLRLLYLSLPKVEFSSTLSSLSSQRVLINFYILVSKWPVFCPRSLPSAGFLTEPTYFKSHTYIEFVIHHRNLSQRSKGKFTQESIRQKEKTRDSEY